MIGFVPVGFSLSQETQFLCSVDRTEVPLGEQFQVTYTLSGGTLRQYGDFRAPDLNRNFLTLNGPSTSQQMQIINGRVSTSIVITSYSIYYTKLYDKTSPCLHFNYHTAIRRLCAYPVHPFISSSFNTAFEKRRPSLLPRPLPQVAGLAPESTEAPLQRSGYCPDSQAQPRQASRSGTCHAPYISACFLRWSPPDAS